MQFKRSLANELSRKIWLEYKIDVASDTIRDWLIEFEKETEEKGFG